MLHIGRLSVRRAFSEDHVPTGKRGSAPTGTTMRLRHDASQVKRSKGGSHHGRLGDLIEDLDRDIRRLPPNSLTFSRWRNELGSSCTCSETRKGLLA